MKKVLFAACGLLACTAAQAQDKGFTMLPSGLQYNLVKDAPGDKKAKSGDYVLMHLQRKSADTLLFDSRTLNNNEPVPYPIANVAFAGDPVEALMMVTPGDSIVIRVPVDSLRKNNIQYPYTGLDMYIKVVDIKTKTEMEEEAKKKAEAQKGIDDKLIADYLKKNKIKAKKTESGLYYSITKPGEGEVIKAGQTAHVMYVGKLLDGTIFDANMGADAKHTDPLQVRVGQGMVIKGWDEGLLLLKKGEKATFYIPSPMAYGPQSPSPAIPANSVLVFDVEITNVVQ
ncbi:MAG: FKBP-type peptidyl-prolyl cis-trans isomerase [Flavipsychrobacter sp.]|nr:FKBP-type peptidyl-prolyl cis-trans isomerase [Flavipsychrobacter sp.]